ncbi:MAG: SoxR reducing system RseC family protein [Porphyromonadaceae bacterium]|nr:SoxR reducing system RseC family protein [Porphyromonadaceae bacterium]
MVSVQRREGTVCDIDQNQITVRIQQLSACAGCHAKDFCCSTDCAERYIRVQTSATDLKVGDVVWVEGEDRLGRLAVFLSFVLPILILVMTLVVGLQVLKLGELTAILLSFALLGLYYVVLKLADSRLRQIIKFNIRKLDQAS